MNLKGWQYAALAAAVLAIMKTVSAPGTTEQIERIARAIATAEGYGIAGAIPTLRNNPGNIRSSAGPIATYPTIEDGWAALYRQVRLMLAGGSSYYQPTMTLSEVARVYTGESAYMNWANNVARILGVSIDTPFGEL